MQWYEYYVGKWSVGSGKNGLPENWDSCKAKMVHDEASALVCDRFNQTL